MPNIDNKKMKCFMRRAKNGAIYRACAVPKGGTSKTRQQIRGNPVPEEKRKLPVRKAYPDRPPAKTQAPNAPTGQKVKFKIKRKEPAKKEEPKPKSPPKPASPPKVVKKKKTGVPIYKGQLLENAYEKVANPKGIPLDNKVKNYIMSLQTKLKKEKKEKGEEAVITGAEFKKIVKDAHERYDPDKGNKKQKRKLRVKEAFKPPASWNSFYNDFDKDLKSTQYGENKLTDVIDNVLGGNEDAERSPKLTKQHKLAREGYAKFLKTPQAKEAKDINQLADRYYDYMEKNY